MSGNVSKSKEDDEQEIFRQATEAAARRVAEGTEAPVDIGPPQDPYGAMKRAYEEKKRRETEAFNRQGGAVLGKQPPPPPLNETPTETPPRPEAAPPPAAGMSQPQPPPPETKTEKRLGPGTRDPDLDLSGGGTGVGGAGGGSVLIPGGMRPEKLETTAKLGKPYPEAAKAALGAAAGLELEAAGTERDIRARQYKDTRDIAAANMAANADALAQHQKIQADRERIVRDRLGQIEALNRKAQGKPEELWNERAAFATLLSALFTGIGAASHSAGGMIAGGISGGLIRSLTNQDIASKLEARKAAGEQAKRQTDLLHLHLDNLKNQDRAVEATRLAYYDNILQQAELVKSQLGPQANEAAYQRTVATILKERARTVDDIAKQEEAEVTEQFVQKYHQAQLLGPPGGVAPGIRKEDRVLTIPASDRTGEHEVHVAVPHEVYKDLADMNGATNALVSLDREALKLRRQLRETVSGAGTNNAVDSAQRVATIRKELSELQRKRVQIEQKADHEGVTRDSDFKHAMEMGVDYTGGVGGGIVQLAEHDKTIQHSMNQLNRIMDDRVRGATGWVVHPDVVQEPAHEGKGAPIVKRPGFTYTGQLYRGRAVPPEGDEQEVK